MYNTKQITTMKKTFFYMLACILPALALTSCSSDDGDSSPKYEWGIREISFTGESRSPLYKWLTDEVDKLQKSYNGSGRYDTDETALSKVDEGVKLIEELSVRFADRQKAYDDCGIYFTSSYACQALKDGKEIKSSKVYELINKSARAPRLEADYVESIPVSRAFDTSDVAARSIEIPFSKLGFGGTDKGMSCALDSNYQICLVNSKTLEFSKSNPFRIEVGEKEDGSHVVILSYSFDKKSFETWKGEWYFLVPVKIDSTRDLKFDVNIE